jgi:iron complex outermembrane receptor protein
MEAGAGLETGRRCLDFALDVRLPGHVGGGRHGAEERRRADLRRAPTVTFGDGIADPTAVRAHAVSNGEITQSDKLHEGRLNLSWNREMGRSRASTRAWRTRSATWNAPRWNSDSWNAFSGYHLALPASLFTVTPMDDFFGSGGQVPKAFLRFDPMQYMNYLNQPSLLPQSNDPALYSDKTKFPNGPMAIDYTKPSMRA